MAARDPNTLTGYEVRRALRPRRADGTLKRIPQVRNGRLGQLSFVKSRFPWRVRTLAEMFQQQFQFDSLNITQQFGFGTRFAPCNAFFAGVNKRKWVPLAI